MRLVDDNDELFLARIPKHPADMAHAVLRCHGQDGSDRDVIPDRHRHRRMLAGDRQQLDARNAVVCERRCELAELAERLLDELLPMHEPDDAIPLRHTLRQEPCDRRERLAASRRHDEHPALCSFGLSRQVEECFQTVDGLLLVRHQRLSPIRLRCLGVDHDFPFSCISHDVPPTSRASAARTQGKTRPVLPGKDESRSGFFHLLLQSLEDLLHFILAVLVIRTVRAISQEPQHIDDLVRPRFRYSLEALMPAFICSLLYFTEKYFINSIFVKYR